MENYLKSSARFELHEPYLLDCGLLVREFRLRLPSPILNLVRCKIGSLRLPVLNVTALAKATGRPTGNPIGDTEAPRIVCECNGGTL